LSRPKGSKNSNPAKEKIIFCRVTNEEYAWCNRFGCISRYIKTLIRIDKEQATEKIIE
jgi:hypothetical protein